MQTHIYKLLYFTDIGGKMRIKRAESELIWRNLLIYRGILKRTSRRFKMEPIDQDWVLIWRVK